MKRQELRLSVSGDKKIKIKASKTKTEATASQAGGGTITLKGTRHGN